MADQVSELFDPAEWVDAPAGAGFTDITYHHSTDGRIARVAFDRPEVRNAFRPHTVDELYRALEDARTNPRIGVVLLTGNGPSAKDGGWAFCSGGDQRIRGRDGYKYEASVPEPVEGSAAVASTGSASSGAVASTGSASSGAVASTGSASSGAVASTGSASSGAVASTGSASSGAVASTGSASSGAVADSAGLGRLHILEVQRLIRFMPKVVIAVVPGWAAGGGHSLHVVCDLTIASREHGRFKQTDADVGSFDAGYGSAYFARQIGQKFAREVFFLAEEYSADRAYEMGAVNRVVPHADLEREAIAMARTILTKSPTAIRMLKFAFNAVDDGMVGQQVFAGEATRLAYGTDEAVEGRDAFLEKRDPDWGPYPWHF
ncbi:1,4-dihydroxy-2-naphthoyl-CoA synthase [Agromyces larvae]|uniref:1,4-dihydroxy-2-naphthoyl-CoA synthase n=1 Tax=Agromyces larvae TaxID=2929802 RepID=A0ABY4BX31_9MICO|nr:1,4-dihydroxy-2-naphthoyl-CoA synthase [Agromyces larvae]UOE43791.1 enoyl-CoA hydratase-related protein [Agromyces larvae]